MMQTLIVSYRSDKERDKFKAENTTTLGKFDVVWVMNDHVAGVDIAIVPGD